MSWVFLTFIDKSTRNVLNLSKLPLCLSASFVPLWLHQWWFSRPLCLV